MKRIKEDEDINKGEQNDGKENVHKNDDSRRLNLQKRSYTTGTTWKNKQKKERRNYVRNCV